MLSQLDFYALCDLFMSFIFDLKEQNMFLSNDWGFFFYKCTLHKFKDSF